MKELVTENKNSRCPIVAKTSSLEKAREFLSEASQFRLGNLPTETRHPKTMKLSQLSISDLPQAIQIFNEVDLEAVGSLHAVVAELQELTKEIRNTLADGGRIFLCGCGATGRLSISLEAIWREEVQRSGRNDLQEKLFSFIAGGDFALVRSIENFEDHPEFGVRQLYDLGFRKGDLLISSTEGGETPFVIGATAEAAKVGGRSPFFLFCNPAEILKNTTLRSKNILENNLVKKIELKTGPMVLSGSTRLQATTVQQLAVGACLFSAIKDGSSPEFWIKNFENVLKTSSFKSLAPLIEQEAAIYKGGDICVHQTDRFGITVLTDTTERTPTFSLLPFESVLEKGREPSWTYLSIPGATSSLQAWQSVLGRSPRSLDWEDYRSQFGAERTLAYDFSANSLSRRQGAQGTRRVHIFEIFENAGQLNFKLGVHKAAFDLPELLLSQHLLVKCAMNISSTLLMGRLGRFLGNVMVFVRPTNKKLIDRSIRYIQLLLQDEGISHFSYEKICETLFEEFEVAKEDVPVVIRTFERLKGAYGN